MRKIAIVEWGEPLQALEAPTPAPSGSEVLVRVEACGVCHSDVHIWDGYFDLGAKGRLRLADRGTKLPFTPGHEIVGRVAALGPDAEGVAIGKSYIVYPWIGCGQCAACRGGKELLCPLNRALGVRCDGGFGDHVIVPHPRYLVPYDGIQRDLACTYACSGITAFSALKKALPLAAEDWVCVIGAGGVGASALQMAAAVTSAKVLVADIDAAKREYALGAGAAAVVDNGAAGAVKQVMTLTNGGAAAVIDFVGSGATLQFAMDAARRGGKVVVVGLFGGAATIAPILFPNKLLTVQGSYVGTLEDLKELIGLVQAGRIAPIPIETRPAADASAVLADLKSGGRILGRVVLTHDAA
ncbi:MAG: alcohol dehydrogenase [Hyphomicrobiales bacterium]